MTVLKSFDLKGNKQSFAGWISNLSPCDTPFVSMIGKESTSQTQYSWQMDALDTPKHVGYEEGSAVVPEQRHPTHVTHNFTQTLRKVAHVSDTTASISLYGRDSEMNYQMGKAGKELKRDMEFMCLNNGAGNIGTKNLASKFSGFLPLCAPKGYIDLGTGAETYKSVNVADINGPWFHASDLFDLTYNLYLAGSKANKIMFHPRHATTFSDFMGNNIDSALTYRMFSGLSNEYNAKVSKIRDPLAQTYDLIPNRFMPEDKIYIFNESDWTQMILRQPAVSKLGKQGSAERFLLETEIGLRHRHVNASGILDLTPSQYVMAFTKKPVKMTSGLGLQEKAEVMVSIRESGGPIDDGSEVTWKTSNPLIVSIQGTTTAPTAGGLAEIDLRPERAGSAIITATCGDSVASFRVDVSNPNIRLTMSNSLVEKAKKVLAVAYVTDHAGTPVVDGTSVSFRADPSTLVELQSISAVTAAGTAQIEVTARQELGLVQLQANIGENKSNFARLEIVDKVQQLAFEVLQRTLAVGINDSTNMEVSVTDGDGVGILNELVFIASTDTDIIDLGRDKLTTGAQGNAILKIVPKNIGTTRLIATYGKQVLEIDVVVTAPLISIGGPGEFVVNREFDISAAVRRSDGTNPGAGAEVSFVSEPPFSPLIAPKETDVDGISTVSYTPLSNSDLEVTAYIGTFSSNTLSITEATLGHGVLRAPEMLTRPIAIGGKSNAKVLMTDDKGMALQNATVTWTVEPAGIVEGSSATTTTDQNGMSLLEVTGVAKGVGRVSYRCDGKTSQVTNVNVGQATALAFINSPINPKINENTVFTAIIRRDEDNAPVSGADVTFSCDSSVGGFPKTIKTDASGAAVFENFFPDAGDFNVTATVPEYSHTKAIKVTVLPPDTSVDKPYVQTFVGNTKKVTHDTNQFITITTLTKLWGSAALGTRIDVRSLDPHIAVATLNDLPATSQGKHTFTVKGNGPGVARIQFKARDNAGGWIDVPVTVGSPTLEIIVSPTTMSAGTAVEFAAVYKDCDGNWAPGMKIRWEHPLTMLAGREQIPESTTDQFGRTFFASRGGAWATHTFRAVLSSNDAIRSIDKSITVHM